MRKLYGHYVRVVLGPGGDARAIGGAVTVALCGRLEHPPPCRVPHHTAVDAPLPLPQVGARVVFACTEDEELEVRRQISAAALAGHLDGPAGPVTWSVEHLGPVELTDDERHQFSAWTQPPTSPAGAGTRS